MSQDRGSVLRLLEGGPGAGWTAAVTMLVGGDDRTVVAAAGVADPDTGGAATPDTRFDLASLTKPFTAAATLRLAAKGRLGLDARIADFGFPYPGVTVRHLLTHSSGLPASARLHRSAHPPRDIWDDLRQRIPEAPPGTAVRYSDVGYIILGRVLEQATGQSLDQIMREQVLDPLELRDTSFGLVPGAAATELDPWRGRRLRGEVHDESAAVLGGQAGHAGLFGTAGDVVALIHAFARGTSCFLPDDLRRAAISEQARTGHVRWGLGWKLRSDAPDAAEASLSESAFGHYGFTGTSIWHDPERSLTVCLLTNRVYFGRDPVAIFHLRRDLTTWACRWSDSPEQER